MNKGLSYYYYGKQRELFFQTESVKTNDQACLKISLQGLLPQGREEGQASRKGLWDIYFTSKYIRGPSGGPPFLSVWLNRNI